MTDLLSIGASGVNVYQRALSTVSNNIANLATEGYSRQTTDISQNKPRDVGSGFVGTGAYFDRVSRQYDAFLEQSLQKATADLEAQSSALRFTDKILDLVGDDETGMTSAFDQYFASAKNLSTDPASTTLRGIYLRDAGAVTTRFQGLAAQIKNISTESLEAIEADTRAVNSITSQLAQVNRQLLKEISADSQPPELMDRRDQLLRQLSEYIEINTAFDIKGRVQISLTESNTRGLLLSGNDASELKITQKLNNSAALDYTLSGPEKKEFIGGIASGSLGGYTQFYERTLNAVNTELDRLVYLFSDAVNDIQETGLNAFGELGDALFRIEPSFEIDRRASTGNYEVQTTITEPANFVSNNLVVSFNEKTERWTAVDQATGETAIENSGGAITINGATHLISGSANSGDTFELIPGARAASGIRVALSDPREVAAASLFRATPDNQNVSGAHPMIQVDRQEQLLPALNQIISSNPEPTRAIPVTGSLSRPFANIPAGTTNLSFFVDPNEANPLALQLFTTEGKHLLGQSIDAQRAIAMLTTENGFMQNVEYDDQHLNGQGLTGYRDFSVFYGARSKPNERTVETVTIDSETGNRLPETRLVTDAAEMTSQGIGSHQALANETLTVIQSGAIRLNGSSLPALTLQPNEALTAKTIASWLNTSATAQGLLIEAVPTTELVVDAGDIDFDQSGFYINGVAINPNASDSAPMSLDNLHQLIEKVNERSDETNVIAYIDEGGLLVLTNAAGFEGETFKISSASGANRSTITTQVNHNVVGEFVFRATDEQTEINLELTSRGSPSDLAVLGLRTELSIDGQIDEQLVVMATGVEQVVGQGRVSSSYSTSAEFNSFESLRKSPLDIKFVSGTTVTVTERHSGTELARRELNEDGSFTYRDLKIVFDEPPATGDEFVIDGNNTGPNQAFDAQGNNLNILRIVDLEASREISDDSRTITERYLGFVNVVGNESVQAQISRDALTVIKDQAIEARDAVSGVNLDQEAADLIRFQQAYQASAQVMQVASRLFDSILQVR